MFLKRVLSLFLICLGLVFVSCSDIEASDEGSLSLTFNGSDFLDSSARDIYPDSSFNGMYIVASVLGDYTETKKLEITNAGKYKIKFDYVPKGASVYVRADVFRLKQIAPTGGEETVPFKHLYTGQSKKKTVSMKNEKVSLVMKNMVDGCDYSVETGYKKMRCDDIFYKGTNDLLHNTVYILFFNNGKFQIVFESGPIGATTFNAVSEGIWSGSLTQSGNIFITELIYDPCHLDTPENNCWFDSTGNFVMPVPKTRAFWFKFNYEEVGKELTIESMSGLRVTYAPY